MKKSRLVNLHYGDMTDSSSLIRIIQQVQPDEIYNLAAQSHGLQLSPVNLAARGKGLQIGLYNYYKDNFKGFQLGLVNANPSTRMCPNR